MRYSLILLDTTTKYLPFILRDYIVNLFTPHLSITIIDNIVNLHCLNIIEKLFVCAIKIKQQTKKKLFNIINMLFFLSILINFFEFARRTPLC